MSLRAERSLTGCGRHRARPPRAAGPRAPAAGGAGRRGAGLAKGACPTRGGRGAGTAPPLSFASLFQTQAGIVTSPPAAPSQRAACSRPTWVRRLAIGRRRRGRPGFVPPPRRPASPERSGGGGADRVLRRCLGPRRHRGVGRAPLRSTGGLSLRPAPGNPLRAPSDPVERQHGLWSYGDAGWTELNGRPRGGGSRGGDASHVRGAREVGCVRPSSPLLLSSMAVVLRR